MFVPPSPQLPNPGKFACAPGERPIEGYTLRRGIHRGGFGEVYYAVSDAGKEVALKLIQHHLEIELRGIRQCLNLKHPNLVTLFDIRTDADGDHWVVMEYLSGTSLADVMAAFPRGLPLEEVAGWLSGIAAGTAFLHERGLVHRDLKPANIYRENGVVKVADVGLSKRLTGDRRAQHTESVGTIYYMAPEVAHGRYGIEVDVYSLAVVLFEMLTGRLPFDGETTGEIVIKQLTMAPDLSGLPVPLRPVLARALAKDPALRTTGVMELEQEFLQAAATLPDGPHLARPMSQVLSPEIDRLAKTQPVENGPAGPAAATELHDFLPVEPTSPGRRASTPPYGIGATSHRHGQPAASTFHERLERVRAGHGPAQLRRPPAPERSRYSAALQTQLTSPPSLESAAPLLVAGAIVTFGAMLMTPKHLPLALGIDVALAVVWLLLTVWHPDRILPARNTETTSGVTHTGQAALTNNHSVLRSLAVSWTIIPILTGVATAALLGVRMWNWGSPEQGVLLVYHWTVTSMACLLVVTWPVLPSLARASLPHWPSAKPLGRLQRWQGLAGGGVVGSYAYFLAEWLSLPGLTGPPSWALFNQLGVHPLVDEFHRPTLLGSVWFFAGLFTLKDWNPLVGPTRPQRCSLISIVWTLCITVFWLVLFQYPFMAGCLLAGTISWVAAMAAPWSPPGLAQQSAANSSALPGGNR